MKRDAGNATVELAVSLPALVLLLIAGLFGIAVMRTQLECVDAAREFARAAARGADPPAAPAGTTASVTSDGETVRAAVSAHVQPFGGRLPGFDVSATAVADVEPGVAS